MSSGEVQARRFFISGLLVLTGVGAITYRSLNQLALDAAQVSHSHEVIATLASIEGELAKASSARRGFVLSRDSGFVQQFISASDRFDDLFAALKPMVARAPVQVERSERLGALGRVRLDQLRALMDEAGRGARTIREPLPSDPVPQALRVTLLSLNAEQRRELTSRESRAQQTELLADVALLAGFALSFTLFAMAWRRAQRMAIARESSNRLLAERALALDISNRKLQDLLLAAAGRLEISVSRLDQLAPAHSDGEVPEVLVQVTRLINDLRTYAQLLSHQPARERVLLDEIVKRVVRSLRSRIVASGGSVTLGPLPEVMGDRALIERAIWQLVDNALAYHRPDTPPQVRVEATTVDQTVTLSVRDNGIGILRDDQARAFDLFERLGRDDSAGHGIGLPIAQRAAELLRTRIVIESIPGEGSVFSLTLPRP